MEENFETIKSKVQKLNALVERGEEGESLAAKRVLSNLLKTYNLTLQDVLGMSEEKREYDFTVSCEEERTILSHCYFYVSGKDTVNIRVFKERKKCSMELTAYEYAEIKNLYDWHKSQFSKEKQRMLNDLTSAYIIKHRLFPEIHDNKEPKDLSSIDLERARRIMLVEGTLDDDRYTKMLEGKR